MTEEIDVSELVKELRETNELARRQLERASNWNTVTVTHKDSGPGRWQTAAIVACFATWFALILFAMEIHDLRAWRDIHQNHINALEAKQK